MKETGSSSSPILGVMDPFRRKQLDEAVSSRILILDGAMGTMLQARNPTAADFGGAGLDNCNENLCRTVIGWVYLTLSSRPEEAERVSNRLERELQVHLEKSKTNQVPTT